jgi:hypothetical protein
MRNNRCKCVFKGRNTSEDPEGQEYLCFARRNLERPLLNNFDCIEAWECCLDE